MSEEIVYMFDAYMKKSILNCVKRYAKKELVSKMREVSLDSISENLNNDETALLSSKDICAVFDFNEENRENKKLEEYFSDDEVVQAVIGLSDEEKNILLLTILGGYTAEEVGKMYDKTANNIRVMICNAKKKIKKDYKGGV